MKNTSTKDKALKYGVIGVIVIASYFLGKRFLSAFKKDSAEANLSTDQSAQQAQALRAAFNPSGNNWMMAMDSTDTAKVFLIAKEITDFSKVQRYYRDLYKSSLTDDLTSELSASELTRFWEIINGKKSKAQASAKSQEAIKLGKYKYKVGNRLKSVSFKGNQKSAYATIEKGQLKILAWHSVIGAYLGTVTGFMKIKMKDYDGVTRYLSAYYVKDLPNGETFGNRKIFVLERETALM